MYNIIPGLQDVLLVSVDGTMARNIKIIAILFLLTHMQKKKKTLGI